MFYWGKWEIKNAIFKSLDKCSFILNNQKIIAATFTESNSY